MIPPSRDPRRGEIWRVDFDPSVGEEQRKPRPAVVLNPDSVGRLALRIVVPITDWKSHHESAPWFVRLDPSPLNGLDKPSGADGFQVKSLSVERFERRLGNVTADELAEITATVALCIGLELS